MTDLLERIKKLYIQHKDLLLSRYYPINILEKILNLYISEMPFFVVNNNVIFSLRNDDDGIYLSNLLFLRKHQKIVEDFYSALMYVALKGLRVNKPLKFFFKKELKARVFPIRHCIINQKTIYQRLLYNGQLVFIGKHPWETFIYPYVRKYDPFLELKKLVKYTPFGVEVYSMDEAIISHAIESKGIVFLYSPDRFDMDIPYAEVGELEEFHFATIDPNKLLGFLRKFISPDNFIDVKFLTGGRIEYVQL